MFTAEQRIESLAATLEALVAQVPAAEFNDDDDRYTAGEGSQFNVELARSGGAAVHNPFLIEALLTASIAELRDHYGLPVGAEVDLTNRLSATQQ